MRRAARRQALARRARVGGVMARKGIVQKSITIDGQKRYFYGSTVEEVEKKIEDYKNGNNINFCKEFESWLFEVKRYTVKETTFDRLETTYRTMIRDKFSGIGLDNVSSKFVQMYINTLADKYSYSSVKKSRDALNEFFNYCVRFKLASENPVEYVTIPRREYCEVKEREIKIPTREEVQQLIDYTYSKKEDGTYKFNQVHTHGIILIIYTGMRAGELLALKWKDVDFEKREIKIEATSARVKVRDKRRKVKYEEKESTPKTKNGKRTIYLNKKAIEALKAIKEEQKTDFEYVVSNKGSPTTYAALQKVLHRVQKEAGLPISGLHLYRHYFASECLSLGIKPIELSRMLGHARVNITLDIYGHLTETMRDDMRSRLDLM